jgi:hypothetical protein
MSRMGRWEFHSTLQHFGLKFRSLSGSLWICMGPLAVERRGKNSAQYCEKHCNLSCSDNSGFKLSIAEQLPGMTRFAWDVS